MAVALGTVYSAVANDLDRSQVRAVFYGIRVCRGIQVARAAVVDICNVLGDVTVADRAVNCVVGLPVSVGLDRVYAIGCVYVIGLCLIVAMTA